MGCRDGWPDGDVGCWLGGELGCADCPGSDTKRITLFRASAIYNFPPMLSMANP